MQVDTGTSSTVILSRVEYEALKRENEDLKKDLAYVRFQMDKLKKMLFASRGERFRNSQDPTQLTLGFEVPTVAVGEPATQEITYSRKKPAPGGKPSHQRMPLPAHLPRVVEEIEPPQEEIQGMTRIGSVVSETLEYKEAELYVRQIIRWKYAPKSGEKVVIAPLPAQPIPRGNAGPSLLAYLLVCKMVDHMPFYRLVQILKRVGISLAESTLNDWMAKVCRLMEPLYDLLKKEALTSGYIQSDDTIHQVLTRDKPGASHRGYMMAYLAPWTQLLFFDYQPNRNRQVVHEMLKDFQGVVQTDGLNIYDNLAGRSGVTLLACWAHARRKFFDAREHDPQRAELVLTWIQQLYAVERYAKEEALTPDEIYALRQERSKPVLDEMKAWLTDLAGNPMILKKSPIGAALNYVLPLWDRLSTYVKDGRYLVDNNPIENAIRPLVLGRKNYLFAGSHEGAKRLAMIYSFTGSCKLAGINPQSWFTDVLTRIQDAKQSELVNLLPNRWVEK